MSFVVETDKKVCTKCGDEKSLKEFYFNRVKDEYYSSCKKCHNKLTTRWRIEHPTDLRFHKLKHRYGLTIDEYNNLLEKQKNCCDICERPFGEYCVKRGPHVDHDHSTGKVRGLLCSVCNRLLGCSFDNVKILENAIKYLKKYGK